MACLAKKTTGELVDDLDGTVLDEDGTTVSFSVDGPDYEIDLGAEYADELREAFTPYIVAGLKATGARRGPVPRPLLRPRRAATRPSAARRAPGFATTGTKSVCGGGSPRS
jgi:hypothetical protein